MSEDEKEQSIAEEFSGPVENSEFYKAFHPAQIDVGNIDVPAEIIKCAVTIENYMKANGLRRWQLFGVCDRQFAFDLEHIKAVVAITHD